RAYLSPPVSGTYSFWLAGNSTAQLLLSSDDDPAHAQSIVTLSEASGYRNFDNGGLDVQHLQRSAPIQLEAGKTYYIEVLHKASTGSDSVSVAWNIPATAEYPGEVRKLLDPQFLSPFSSDLAVTKSLADGQSASAKPGSDVGYQVQVTNKGSVAVKNVQVVDVPPTGFSLSPADANGWVKGFRYVRFEADSEIGGSSGTTTLAELGLLDGNNVQISKAGWTASAASEGLNEGNSGGPANYAIDNDSSTFWATEWWPSSVAFPHTITIDTGAPRTLSGFTYLARQNSTNGRVGNYKFFVSEDGTNWIEVKTGSLANSTALQAVTFTQPTPTRIFKTIAGPIAPGATATADITLHAPDALTDGAYVNNASLIAAQEANGSRVFDPNSANNSGSATVQVSNNTAPVAQNDRYSTNEDTLLTIAAPGLLANDSDTDGNPLSTVKLSDPAHGALALNANGAFSYTPDADWSGTDSFTYQASDGAIGSNAATVSIVVDPLNDAPVANDDSFGTNEDSPLSIAAPGLLANDTDAESSSLTAVMVDNPAHGSLTLSASGAFTYTPAANWSGSDSFTYRASDGTANSNLATVTITVSAANDAPVAENDRSSTDEDTKLTIAAPGLLANDHDPDGDPLTASVIVGPSHGTLTLSSDGAFTYTPAANWSGSDSFTYQASDGTANSNLATVTITVNDVNDAPVAANDSFSTDRNTPLSVPAKGVLSNDTDIDSSTLSALLVSGPTHGTLDLSPTGAFSY
ncbi:MAG: tandem-95 repeat protein, partial [Oscillochloris sp.]|nr:tandem-95 repeat protein [Oscillochloris sp.]